MDEMLSLEQDGSDEGVQDKKRGAAKWKAWLELKSRIGSDGRAEAIVERVNARLQSGVRASRIRAECEGGITARRLEHILKCEHADQGRPFSGWWEEEQTIHHLLALEKWADEEDSGNDGSVAYAETAVFNRIYGLLDMAHRARTLVAITGLYGIGKSFAARQYALEHPRGSVAAGAVMFEFPPGCKGDVGVLDAVLLALEPHSPAKGTVSAKIERILSALRPGDFLIADECGIPADRGAGLRYMSYINEQAGVPVAMIGNPAFHTAVWGNRTDYDALASRTRHVSLGGNGAEDVDAFMAWKGFSGRRWKDALFALAREPGRNGGIRSVVLMLDELERIGLELTPESFIGLAKSYGRVSE